ncbi:hypothetical protein QCA50_016263 [Cerrena zonata]|uniref:Uncharacterized protein n=1 Tax=Cerrena zonata TaxID=2478898 RepID=A0AAW0FVG0_9APHY
MEYLDVGIVIGKHMGPAVYIVVVGFVYLEMTLIMILKMVMLIMKMKKKLCYTEVGHGEDEDEGEPNEYDSQDSFIDERDMAAISNDLNDSENDYLSSGDNNSVSGGTSWRGFDDDDGSVQSRDSEPFVDGRLRDLLLQEHEHDMQQAAYDDSDDDRPIQRRGVIHISSDEEEGPSRPASIRISSDEDEGPRRPVSILISSEEDNSNISGNDGALQVPSEDEYESGPESFQDGGNSDGYNEYDDDYDGDGYDDNDDYGDDGEDYGDSEDYGDGEDYDGYSD